MTMIKIGFRILSHDHLVNMVNKLQQQSIKSLFYFYFSLLDKKKTAYFCKTKKLKVRNGVSATKFLYLIFLCMALISFFTTLT